MSIWVEVTVLFFFFLTDILKLEHLWEFTSLTKLQLNNNLIRKIEGLDNLTNITWLGKIYTSICHLIYRIQNKKYIFIINAYMLNNCKHIHVPNGSARSVIQQHREDRRSGDPNETGRSDFLQQQDLLHREHGHTQQPHLLRHWKQLPEPVRQRKEHNLSCDACMFIDLLEMGLNNQTWPRLIIHIYVLIPQVIYLRRFKNLHTLNLAGNPLAQEVNYKLFIAAYLSDLAYLDYRLLNGETVSCKCCRALVYTVVS